MTTINQGVLDGVRRVAGKFRDLTIDGGIAGAPLGFRLRGATQSGPPKTGTWKAGDEVPDRNGAVWTCITAGTGPTAAWAGSLVGLAASGDTTGATDTSNINGLLNLAGKAVLQAGQFYTTGLTMAQNATTFQGAGQGTVINVPGGDTGLTVSSVSQAIVSDMAFSLGSSSLGIQVNGAGNSNFERLYFTGSSASGAISINGDDSTEQNWTNCVCNDVGGTAISYTRTTTTDTGGVYFNQVRCVGPPTTATHGWSFTSTAGSVTPANIWMYQCVADSYSNTGMYISNIRQFHGVETWSTLGSSANSGQYPLHITGPVGDISFIGGYLYQFINNGYIAMLDGSASGVYFGGGIIFDGAGSGGYALGLNAASGVQVGDIFYYSSNFSDAPWIAGTSTGYAPRTPFTILTQGNNSAAQSFGIDDVNNLGNQVWLRNNDGTLQFRNTGSSATIAALTQGGVWTASLTPPAGTATQAPLVLSSGTSLTAPAAGAIEYDGTCFYATSAGPARATIDTEQWGILQNPYTLTSTTALQILFNWTANGALTVGVGDYFFECEFTLSSLSATSGAFSFGFGGTANIDGILYTAIAAKAALSAGAATITTATVTTATALCAANTTTTGHANIRGTLQISSAGTIIPQIALGVAAAAVVGDGSWFRAWPVTPSDSIAYTGNWS